MRICLLIILNFLPILAFSQEVTGVVYEFESDPIIGATVMKKGAKDGVVTDFDGRFRINASLGDTLVIRYIGLPSQEVILDSIYVDIYLKVHYGPLYCGPIIFMIAEKYKQANSYYQIEKWEIPITQVNGQQDVYNKVPGLFMHAGALNTNRLTIRGIGSRSPFSTTKIRAYVNDIPITTGIGESNLEDINLSFINDISIYKGPTRPSLGSGLGGAIHYKTKRSLYNSIELSHRFTFGSYNTLQNNTQAAIHRKNFFIALNYDNLSSDGYRENNGYLRNTFSGFAEAYLNKGILSFFINSTSLASEIPSALNRSDFDANPQLAAANWKAVRGNEQNRRTYGGISYKLNITSNFHTSNTIFGGKYTNDERRPFNVLSQNSTNLGIRSISTLQYNNSAGALSFGTELFSEKEFWNTSQTIDSGQGDLLSSNEELRRYVNIFVENRYRWKSYALRLGLNANFTRYVLEDQFLANDDQSGLYNYDPIVSPFASIEYKSTGRKIYYLSLSHGYSLPTLEETLTPDGLINPEIRPETGYNFEFGTRQMIRDWEIEASIYYMLVSNLLVSERVTEDQYIGVNAGRTAHPGLELNVQKSFALHNDIKIQPSVSYQFGPHKFLEFINRDQDFSGSFLPGNPSHKANVNLEVSYKKLKLNWTNMYVSSMFADDANTISVDGYFLSNLNANIEILKKKDWTLQIYASINNITNSKYASMIAVNPRSFGGSAPRYLYPGLSRNGYIGFQLKYKIDSSSSAIAL